ncbi:MAG: hypothetical protein DRR08_02555 [Candidatus Parabeggiatoa sp. nov. 2]|nr:MAG: hypothetical protein B6247_00795 [Beggiatoa sp. 4572_84]RKZ63754.1 MAG: hypothetical protein DRR08_02555 [Gammaproteobacteria bacterium]
MMISRFARNDSSVGGGAKYKYKKGRTRRFKGKHAGLPLRVMSFTQQKNAISLEGIVSFQTVSNGDGYSPSKG